MKYPLIMKSWFVTFSIFICLLVSAFALSRVDYSWSHWKPATCMPDHCFCEAIHPGTIAQPANTWSSFGFVLIGLWLIIRRRQKPAAFSCHNPILHQSIYTNLYGLALVLTGLGSAFYHASLTFVGQFFDLMGMYLLASFILLYNFAKIYPFVQRTFAAVYPSLNFLLALSLIGLPHWRRYLFAILILTALALEYILSKKNPMPTNPALLRAAVATLIIAFIIWMIDFNGIFCQPESWLQGHAVWHVLGAAAAGLWWGAFIPKRQNDYRQDD